MSLEPSPANLDKTKRDVCPTIDALSRWLRTPGGAQSPSLSIFLAAACVYASHRQEMESAARHTQEQRIESC